ncbi:MAG: hypothetical protein ABSG86_21330 [Thermoguttaceae bacterium]|jgi:tetratricopeptide (TPR) repeat protein
MTANPLDTTIVRRSRDRQALLWVCQPYDLKVGVAPHDYGKPADEVQQLYRADVTGPDLRLAKLYWEAIWIEGARSSVLQVIRAESVAAQEGARRVVVLAGSDDTNAEFSEWQFQPVCVLPGLLDPQAAPDARYGEVRERVRERIADDLAKRLERYPHRLLVVVGVRQSEDLQKRLYPALEDNRVVDLDLLVVYPPDLATPAEPENADVRLHLWRGTVEELISELTGVGAPVAGEPVRWSLRVGKQRVHLAADAMQRILDQFALLTEQDLLPPKGFILDDLNAFLSGDLRTWAGYAAGLPIPRAYVTKAGRSLAEELVAALRQLDAEESGRPKELGTARRTSVLRLPCAGGSGATTLLRAAAFQAAAEGFPTLVLRPGRTDIDMEVLTAFCTALTEAALKQGVVTFPPIALIVDTDAIGLPVSRRLAQTLANQGRRVVLLQAISLSDTRGVENLPALGTELTSDEVSSCARGFRQLIERWSLPIEPIPTEEDWEAYEKRSRWVTPGRDSQTVTLFWVALRFFLTEGMRLTDAEQALQALGGWIDKRDRQVRDEGMRKVLLWVAALSSQRIVCPLATALRPISGGGLSSNQVRVLRQFGDLIEWDDYSRDLQDYTIRFSHPSLGQEYLRRRRGSADPRSVADAIYPMLQQLKPGQPADRWLAEVLVSRVLTPTYEDRLYTDWDWRLSAFEQFPEGLVFQNKMMLHHWARCLYQSADARNAPDMSYEERRHRIERAISQLRQALELPRRQQRDEHPSHLYNTLGVALARLARLLESHDKAMADEKWNEACQAFRLSVDLLPDNVEALLAFSRRLLVHAGVLSDGPVNDATPLLDDVARALGLLDEVEELLSQLEDPDPDWTTDLVEYRTQALRWFDQERVRESIAELQHSDNAELGYYCEAQLVVRQSDATDGLERALEILDRAAYLKPLGPRSLRFELSVFRRHPQWRYDFARLLNLHELLDSATDHAPHPVEKFRHAVLCYQAGQPREGEKRFRRLRDEERRGDTSPPSIRDFWRDPKNPEEPRSTHIRISRWISEWRAEGYVEELGQKVPLRPRHFSPMPKLTEVVPCVIRFEFSGPLAVPKRFVERPKIKESRTR